MNAMVMQVCLDAGICPMHFMSHDYNRFLNELPKDEARRMKRKFRKLWKKAYKQRVIGLGDGYRKNRVKIELGFRGTHPKPTQRWYRKSAVRSMLLKHKSDTLREFAVAVDHDEKEYF